MKYVYCLYDYEEHGPQRLTITADRTKVQEMLWDVFGKPKGCFPAYPAEVLKEAQNKLQELLSQPDSELVELGGDHALQEGWGAITLEIVPLYG